MSDEELLQRRKEKAREIEFYRRKLRQAEDELKMYNNEVLARLKDKGTTFE